MTPLPPRSIAAIEGYLVRCALPEPQGNATGFYAERSSLLVRLVDADGIAGWGETWHSPQAAGALIRHGLGLLLIGEAPADYARLFDAMTATLGYDRRGGVGLMAASALDMALWDLRARQLGLPLSTLLGGARRERVFAYAAGPYFRPGSDPYRSYADEARRFAGEGFRALKAKIGLGPEADRRAVAALRETVGPNVALMADINQACAAPGAAAIAERLEPYGLLWIEEPVEPDDHAGYRRVGRASRTAVAGGEALGGARAFDAFMREAEPDIVQPDLSICGGFTEALRIAALADVRGLPLVPHVWGTAVNFHASLQWAASLPARRGAAPEPYPWFEFDRSPNPLRDIAGPPPLPDGEGFVPVPRGSGLGISLPPDALSPWLVERWRLPA